MTYGGWGLSHAAHPDGRLFVSTFHRAAVFDPGAGPPAFRRLDGCATGVSAMVRSGGRGRRHYYRLPT